MPNYANVRISSGCGTPFPVVAPTATPEAFGAVGNGIANDQAALVAAIASLGGVGTLVLTPGSVYNHNNLLVLNGSTRINGGGYLCGSSVQNAGTLASTNPLLSAVQFHGSTGADGTIFTSNATSRGVTNDEHKVFFDGNNQLFRDCEVNGSRAAGILGEGASNYQILNCVIRNVQADSFHNCCGCNNGYLLNPQVFNSGDDGVAVVSYNAGGTGAMCSDIVIDNPVVRGTNARGCSIVGGTRITYNNIDVEDTRAAGLYIASEPSFTTHGVFDSLVNGGVIRRANFSTLVDHGSILFYADYDVIQNTIVQNIDCYNTAGSAPWHLAAFYGGVTGCQMNNVCVYAPPRAFLLYDLTAGGLTTSAVSYC